jgi:hypothetical protein
MSEGKKIIGADIIGAWGNLHGLINEANIFSDKRQALYADLNLLKEQAQANISEKAIYCLFSVQNNYDQPNNNLVCWWPEKPDFCTFCNAFEINITPAMGILEALEKAGSILTELKAVYDGRAARIYDADYRLERVTNGQILKSS